MEGQSSSSDNSNGRDTRKRQHNPERRSIRESIDQGLKEALRGTPSPVSPKVEQGSKKDQVDGAVSPPNDIPTSRDTSEERKHKKNQAAQRSQRRVRDRNSPSRIQELRKQARERYHQWKETATEEEQFRIWSKQRAARQRREEKASGEISSRVPEKKSAAKVQQEDTDSGEDGLRKQGQARVDKRQTVEGRRWRKAYKILRRTEPTLLDIGEERDEVRRLMKQNPTDEELLRTLRRKMNQLLNQARETLSDLSEKRQEIVDQLIAKGWPSMDGKDDEGTEEPEE